MKVGLVCPYNINKHGGVQEVVLALKDGLEKRGHKVKIITPWPNGSEVEERPGYIFVGTSTDFKSLASTTSQVSSPADSEKIASMLEEENFDILHFHEPWIPFLSRQILQKSNSVNIATFHSKIPEALMTRTVIKVVTPYLKSVLKYLHELTAVSPSGAEYAASLTDQHITLIPNGIDLPKYQRAAKNKRTSGPKTILYVGRLERRKGVTYLLQAYHRLIQDMPEVRLQIAGDGPEREKLELLAEDLNLSHVSFLGYISEEDKLELLGSADLFCSPAIFGESFGIVLLEAMAAGTVCVAGNNSGYIDVMQGLGGISIVNPNDREEFARRIKLLLNEKELREAWQKWATKQVKQYSYERVVDHYETFYKDSLKQHG
jgi:phosphatidyl-myo-inositol alpha-mannosyltransferase